MSRPSFFNTDNSWTEDANKLALEATKVLKPLYDKYKELGFSPREIKYIIDMQNVHQHLNSISGW